MTSSLAGIELETVVMSQRITPRLLKGFRDYLPEAMIPREALMETARRVYRSYGYSPIDSPALEHLEILTGKGSEETDRQLFQFVDAGKRPVGMRFDLTVPLARFVAQHINELGTPFKRYHIAQVWRGENPQAGRYREFIQCDFDTIGVKSVAADIETALVIYDLMRAIGFEKFTIRLNNRRVLNGLLEKLDLREQSVPVLRALDKLAKIGPEKVAAEMQETAGASNEQCSKLLKLADIQGDNDTILSAVDELVVGNETGQSGAENLRQIIAGVRAVGASEACFQLDVSIARGLDYYTGVIFETFLSDLPGIGSVCSGGRYDNLAELYTKQQLPGIGASLGLDRLLTAMESLNMIDPVRTPAQIFIPWFDESRLGEYLALAARLRSAGFGVEVFPENKKLGQQLKYADRRGFRVAIILGGREFDAGVCQIKDLEAQESTEVSLAGDAIEQHLQTRLSAQLASG